MEMMEKEPMPSIIGSVTLNTATYTNVTFKPAYINFFYGKNGAGKTSISRQIKDGNGLVWNPGEAPENYEVLVYNQDFIDEHFKTLDRINGVFTLSSGDEDKKADQEIETLEDRKRKLQKRQVEISGDKGERNQIASDLEKAENVFQKACLRNTKKIRDRFPKAVKGFSRNPQLSQKINTTAPKDCDEEELKKLYDTAFDENIKVYPIHTELEDEYIDGIPECPLLEEEITSSGTTQFAGFVKRIQALDWLDEGHKRFHETADGYCPYCQKKLDSDFEEKLASCFDAEYQAAVQKIRTFQDQYTRHMTLICGILKSNIDSDCLPVNEDRLEKIDMQVHALDFAIQKNIYTIGDKISSPGTPVKIDDLSGMIREIRDSFRECNKYIRENNRICESLDSQKKACIASVWGLLSFQMQEYVQDYHQAQETAKTANEALDDEEESIQSELNSIAERLSELNKSSVTIQAAVDEINKLLHDSGFEGFEIIKSNTAKDAYQVTRTRNHKVAVRLSDGERHFLSFLYFYNQVKGCDRDGNKKDRIVVIDDPVSSLDGNALFIISSLTREMVEVCYNNSDYRGQRVQGNYIKQIFILTHNAHFHRSITYNQINRFKSVNFYKINKLANQSTIQLCTRPSETEVGELENYNPVKNAYAALWVEYRELHNEIALMNVIHRILDFYFLEMSGRDGMSIRDFILREKRDDFVITNEDGSTDIMPLHLAASMLQYMSAGVEGDMSYISDGASEKQIKDTFEMIFDRLGQSQHYEMMMARSREERK